MSEYVASGHGPRQPLTSQANGFAKPVRSPTWESQDQYRDQSHLVPDRVNELHKKKSGDMTNTDQDSVLEYYKSHTNNKKGPTAVKGKVKKKPATKVPGPADPEYDENNWIHRDKLKEIETQDSGSDDLAGRTVVPRAQLGEHETAQTPNQPNERRTAKSEASLGNEFLPYQLETRREPRNTMLTGQHRRRGLTSFNQLHRERATM
jgi:hypothetical protein